MQTPTGRLKTSEPEVQMLAAHNEKRGLEVNLGQFDWKKLELRVLQYIWDMVKDYERED